MEKYLSTVSTQYVCAQGDNHLGSGASGIAYKLVVLGTSETVAGKAVQITTSQEEGKYERELTILKILGDHPHVISLIAHHEVYPFGFLILKLGENGDLLSYFSKNGDKFSTPAPLLLFFLYLLDGVDHIHSKKIVHSDLKLNNIIVDGRIHPIIIDLDIAIAIDEEANLRGTPAYIDYIQIIAYQNGVMSQYTPYTDIHALGVILYQLAHKGAKPYNGVTEEKLFQNIVQGKYTIKAGVNWFVAALIIKCLAVDVTNRLTIKDMISLIKAEYKAIKGSVDVGLKNDLHVDAYKNFDVESLRPPAPKKPVVVQPIVIVPENEMQQMRNDLKQGLISNRDQLRQDYQAVDQKYRQQRIDFMVDKAKEQQEVFNMLAQHREDLAKKQKVQRQQMEDLKKLTLRVKKRQDDELQKILLQHQDEQKLQQEKDEQALGRYQNNIAGVLATPRGKISELMQGLGRDELNQYKDVVINEGRNFYRQPKHARSGYLKKTKEEGSFYLQKMEQRNEDNFARMQEKNAQNFARMQERNAQNMARMEEQNAQNFARMQEQNAQNMARMEERNNEEMAKRKQSKSGLLKLPAIDSPQNGLISPNYFNPNANILMFGNAVPKKKPYFLVDSQQRDDYGIARLKYEKKNGDLVNGLKEKMLGMHRKASVGQIKTDRPGHYRSLSLRETHLQTTMNKADATIAANTPTKEQLRA